jgi:hypothetical protein
MTNLNSELLDAWNKYKIYAEACIKSGAFPAPFGCTEEEMNLKMKVKDTTSGDMPTQKYRNGQYTFKFDNVSDTNAAHILFNENFSNAGTCNLDETMLQVNLPDIHLGQFVYFLERRNYRFTWTFDSTTP